MLVPPATRWYTDSWGATADEVSAKLPGDDVIPARREISTKAITIAAPPGIVYSLVPQMGQHRAGWSLPETWTENTMAFVMRSTVEGGTRLLLRMRADGTEKRFARWMWNGPLNFGGALFSHKTLVGIKGVAEALPR